MKLAGIVFYALMGALFLVALASAEPAIKVAAGVNGAWLDGPNAAWPADVEAGATGSASLSPHISLVGSGFYGFSHSYFRYDAGARVTATDVDNPDFNAFLGIKYRGGSTIDVRPNEWAPDAGFGWRPFPQISPNVVVGVDAGYGLQSNRVLATVAVRYLFHK